LGCKQYLSKRVVQIPSSLKLVINQPSDVPPTHGDRATLIEEQMSLEEAQKTTNFMIQQPKWLPQNYKLNNVTVIRYTIYTSKMTKRVRFVPFLKRNVTKL